MQRIEKRILGRRCVKLDPSIKVTVSVHTVLPTLKPCLACAVNQGRRENVSQYFSKHVKNEIKINRGSVKSHISYHVCMKAIWRAVLARV